MGPQDDIEILRDTIYELQADKRKLIGDLEEMREQLNTIQEANQTLLKILTDTGYPQTSRGSDEENVYLASKSKSTFHRPSCEWAKYILQSNNLIEFGSHAEAVQAGYKPCKTCRA